MKNRFGDLKNLKNLVDVCIIFGYYINQKINPEDLDLLMILEKKKISINENVLKEIFDKDVSSD